MKTKLQFSVIFEVRKMMLYVLRVEIPAKQAGGNVKF